MEEEDLKIIDIVERFIYQPLFEFYFVGMVVGKISDVWWYFIINYRSCPMFINLKRPFTESGAYNLISEFGLFFSWGR